MFLFLSLILSSFQMIILPLSYAGKRGWESAHPAFSCKEILDCGHSKGKRGWDSAHPAFSCKEILDSGHSKGDGEYWIDPEKSGNPLKVYCDMLRSGGKKRNFFFWDTRTSTGVYLILAILAFSTNILLMFWIKSTAEFLKLISYHQPADLSSNRTVYASYL